MCEFQIMGIFQSTEAKPKENSKREAAFKEAQKKTRKHNQRARDGMVLFHHNSCNNNYDIVPRGPRLWTK